MPFGEYVLDANKAAVITVVERELQHHRNRIRTLQFEIENIHEEQLAPRETDLQYHQDLATVLDTWLQDKS